MAAKLVLCLYLPVALRLIAFGYRLGPPEAHVKSATRWLSSVSA
jgi:hypothetical protein